MCKEKDDPSFTPAKMSPSLSYSGIHLIFITMNSRCFMRWLSSVLWSCWLATCTPVYAAAPLQEITLQLRWKHYFQFAGYYAAIEKGFYHDAGLEVTLKEGTANMDITKEVLAGRAHYGISNPTLLIDRNQGRPVVILASIFQHSPLAIIALEKSGIRSPHDLIGRRVAIAPSRDPDLVAMLLREGVSLDKIIAIPATFDSELDLTEGRTDAYSSYITDRPALLLKKGFTYNIIRPQTYGIDFYGDCLFTSEQEINNNPKRVEAFLAASLRGWEYAMAHQQEIATIIIQKYHSQQTLDQLLFESHAMESLILPDLVQIGHMNPGRWRHIGDSYVSVGLLHPTYTLDGLLHDPGPDHTLLHTAMFVLTLIAVAMLLGILLMLLFHRRLTKRVEQRTASLKSATERLRISEERFRRIFDTILDGYLMSSLQDEILLSNPSAAQLLHYANAGELNGLNVKTALYLDPEDRTTLLALLERNKLVSEYEVAFKCKDQSIITVELSAQFVRDAQNTPCAVELLFRDVTQRKKAEQERIRLMTAIEQAAEIILITDPTGIIQYVNPAFERTTGYSREEGVGQTPRLLKSNIQNHAFYEDLWRTLRRGEIWKGRFINKRKDGTLYDAESTITPVRNASGAIANYVAVTRDITQDLKLEQQLRQAQKMEAMGTLAGGIAHDFNNILSAVIGYTELSLGESVSRQTVHENLEQVLKAADRAKDLVRQILSFSQKIEESKKIIALSPLIKETLELLRASLPSTIEIKSQIKLDSTILAVPSQIHQILVNLCTNAAYAMKERGGLLSVTLDIVTIDANSANHPPDLPPGPYARLTVSDTGSGIPPEIQPMIFDPFFTTKAPGEGSGLGLSIVHSIVASHGGAISVQSATNQGTAFDIYLPVSQNGSIENTGLTPLPRPGTERILLVDDEPSIVDIIPRMLESLGYRVTGFTDSTKALNAFREAPRAFDAIISDYTMPSMTGMDLAGKITAIRPDIPIIIITGFSDLLTDAQLRKAGVKAIIPKPITKISLAGKLRKILESSSPHA